MMLGLLEMGQALLFDRYMLSVSAPKRILWASPTKGAILRYLGILSPSEVRPTGPHPSLL